MEASEVSSRLSTRKAINMSWDGWTVLREGTGKPCHQSHAGFNFLLDYVPNWKTVYLPGGLMAQSAMPAKS